MGANEDVALHGLRVSLGSILDSFGFGTASDNSLDTLTDVMSRFINSISTKSKFYTEHAGRSETAATDLNLAFKKINFSTVELVDFAKHNKLVPPQPMPKFPVARLNPRSLFHPQPSEKELETRPEYIPRHYQAAHPEWTREGADYLAVMKPCTSSDKKGSAPDFPSFDNCTAKSMGISKEDRKIAPPIITRTDDSSATGITSSANIASQKLYNPDYAAQLSKKKNRPLNGLKDSRSSTPIGRSNSPYVDWEDRIRTYSPSTSRSAEKPKFKPRPPSSAARNLFDTKPEVVRAYEEYPYCDIQSASASAFEDRSSSSPMPKLEEAVSGDRSFDVPSEFEQFGQETPPTIVDESVIKKNYFLFQQLKQQQEQEERNKKEKEKEKAEKQRKKEEQKEKKKEAARMKEEQKKDLDDQKKVAKDEEKRRKKEEKRLSLETKAREEAQAREREMQQKLMETMRSIKDDLAPNIFEGEQKPLKLTITNPLSSNASSTFSPSPVRAPPSLRETSPPPLLPPMTNLDDEDTIPYYGGEEAGLTLFTTDISVTETPKKKKKKKDKDKERESSPSSHKKHKKDREHKKKKKRDREEKEKEKDQKQKDNIFYKEPKPEAEQKLPTLKIRLGDQTPSHSDTSASTYAHEPVKIKFKIGTPDEKVPPLRLGGGMKTPGSSTEKPKHISKAEKTPQKFDKEKEEKHRRKEERRKREREEAEQKQRDEYERIQKEHEEKQRKAAEEQKKLDEQVQRLERDREEPEKRREREKKRMERELAHIQATAGLESIIKKKDKEKEREKEKLKEKKPEKEEHKKKEESTRPSAPVADPLDEEDEKMWICPTCHVAWTEGANMVACDACNNWFHWHCVGLLVAPEDDTPWYCKKCFRKPMKRPIKSSSDQPKKKKKSDGHSYLK